VYVLHGPIPVKDVADKLEVKTFKIISELIPFKIFASADKAINEDVQRKLAEKWGFEVRLPTEQELIEKKLTEPQQHFSK
jgi:translation initiation factor IF-2